MHATNKLDHPTKVTYLATDSHCKEPVFIDSTVYIPNSTNALTCLQTDPVTLGPICSIVNDQITCDLVCNVQANHCPDPSTPEWNGIANYLVVNGASWVPITYYTPTPVNGVQVFINEARQAFVNYIVPPIFKPVTQNI